MADDIPAGYYHGRPTNPHGEHHAPPPPPPAEAVDGQVNAQVPGYYAGRVPGKNAAAAAAAAAAPAPDALPAPRPVAAHQPSNESGFFASCFGCCSSGGGTAR